jgi:hypothetical protein
MNIKYFSLANPVSYLFLKITFINRFILLILELYLPKDIIKSKLYLVFNTLNERVDNNDFKVGAQNRKNVSVILDFTKLSYGDLYYFMALLRDDGFITKR